MSRYFSPKDTHPRVCSGGVAFRVSEEEARCPLLPVVIPGLSHMISVAGAPQVSVVLQPK